MHKTITFKPMKMYEENALLIENFNKKNCNAL